MLKSGKHSGRWSVVSGQSGRFKVVLLFISLLLTPHSSLLTEVRADELHYNNILIGDRAAAMGGAYTAISDDSSGCFYNPAGIIYATGRSLSVSVNAFDYSKKTYKDVLGGNGWERVSSNLQPNYFGIIQPLGQGKVGFSYAVPDSISENQKQTFYNMAGSDPVTTAPLTITRYVIDVNDTDKTYNFGPSYALKLNDRFSIGATVYVHYRKRELIFNEFINVDDTGDGVNDRYEWNNLYDSQEEWGVKPILGAMWNPVDKISLGLTVSQNRIFSSDTRLQKTNRGLASNTGGSEPTYSAPSSDDKREFPYITTLGLAYFPSERLVMSTDMSYFSEVSDSQKAVVNVAVGTEYYPTERIALRGGLFTNRANTPTLSSGGVNQPEHIDIYGASLSVTHFTRSSSVTVGGSYGIGNGEAQIISNSSSIQDAEVQNLSAFVSAGYSY